MERITLEDVREFYKGFARLPDDRPDWMKSFNDNTADGYYHFFYQFVKRYAPNTIWELGTGRGGGAAHLGFGNPRGIVITVDVDPGAKQRVERMMLPNVVPVLSNSIEVLDRMQWIPRIDVLFIDATHDGREAYHEYSIYRRHVTDGGIIFFDDIHLNEGMEVMWNHLPDPKVELNGLHPNAGFGAAIKDPEVVPPPISELFD